MITTTARERIVSVCARVFDGGPVSLVAYVAVTGLVFALVLVTVNAHGDDRLAAAEMPARTMTWIENWARHGAFNYAGLVIYSEDGRTVYETLPGLDVWPVYALELAIRGLTGSFSYRAMAVFNQSVIWAGAALLGWLALRLSPIQPRLWAFLLGVACAVVYQTFPINLMNYWYLNPHSLGINAMLCIWLAQDLLGHRPRVRDAITAASVMVLALACSPGLTVMFVAAFGLTHYVLAPDRLGLRRFVLFMALPMAAAFAFHLLQVALVRASVHNVELIGSLNASDFLWRTGLDGSREYYSDHWSLLTQRQSSARYSGTGNPQFSLFWKWLFVGGATAFVAVTARYAVKRSAELRRSVVFLVASVACYLWMAFAFSQGVVIHPDLFDVLLVFPFIIALVGLMPAVLEAMTAGTGVFVLLALLAAACYTMVQLRTYAVAAPIG